MENKSNFDLLIQQSDVVGTFFKGAAKAELSYLNIFYLLDNYDVFTPIYYC